MAKVGFIGLGNPGEGMCKNLIESGNELTVYDANSNAMELGITRFGHELIPPTAHRKT